MKRPLKKKQTQLLQDTQSFMAAELGTMTDSFQKIKDSMDYASVDATKPNWHVWFVFFRNPEMSYSSLQLVVSQVV